MKRAFRKNMAIADIKIGNDRRPIHYEAVKGIAESFKLIGQLHPITVDEEDVLRAGLHRLEAAKLCEWNTIEATIIEAGPEADLAEADENLQRHGLDTLQFSRAVAARKRAWEEINGRAKAGAKPKKGGNLDAVAELPPDRPSFVEETAAMHEVSTRTVERGIVIGESLSEEAVEILENTPLADSPKALAAIAAEPKSKQVAAARRAVKERAAPKEKKPKVKNPAPEVEHWLDPLQEPYEKAAKSIQEASRLVKAIAADEKDGAHLAHLGTFTHIRKNLDEAIQHVKANKPAAGCPKCGDYEIRGKGCKQCYGTGFISAVVHKGLTAKV